MAKKAPSKIVKKKVSKTVPKKIAVTAKKQSPTVDIIKSKKSKPMTRPHKTGEDGLKLANILAKGMSERKAEDIRILDMRGVNGAYADFFVISHAQSDKQVEAIASSAEDELHKQTGESPWHREGFENLEWVLLDYINVVAHIFQKAKREFYGVEELWGDAEIINFKD